MNALTLLDEVLEEWCAGYGRWFEAHHALPPALRAKQVLQDRFMEPITMATLVGIVGASRSSLAAQFLQAFGLTTAQYLARIRMREGLRRLRTGGGTVDDIARAVGYRSGPKFAARVRRSTGLTPAAVRALPDARFDALLLERVPLRVAR